MGLDKLQEKAVVRIIDDDDSMRKSWRFLIEGEGWTTKCYSSALRFLEEDDRDALGCAVLDVRMPAMSGIELQRVMMLQKNGLPIIFVSGHGDIDMAVPGAQRRRNGFSSETGQRRSPLGRHRKSCEQGR